MTTEDIDRALKTLKKWKTAARVKRDQKAEADVTHVEKVLKDLTGRKG